MIIEKITNFIRFYYTQNNKQFEFTKKNQPILNKGEIGDINLYIHIPFCKNNCPYCPYYKEEWDENKAYLYFNP